jgi:MOSC domain-containing protein YiiM
MASAPEIIGLYAGGITLIGDDSARTGIVKTPRARALVTASGIAGDIQADRRFHGGPDKAIHHYAAENYRQLAARFPAAVSLLRPGGLGENISTEGWDEDNVAIGDVFAAGEVAVQVSQPRSPCWKINARLGEPDASRWIAEHGVTGWYFRVLAGGELAPGQPLARVSRPATVVSLRDFWRLFQQHRPAAAALGQLLRIEGLAPDWQRRIRERIAWLDAPA